MLDAKADGDRPYLQRQASSLEALEDFARGVARGEHGVVARDALAAAQSQRHQLSANDLEIFDAAAEAQIRAELVEATTHRFEQRDEAVRADMRSVVDLDIRIGAELHEGIEQASGAGIARPGVELAV